MNTRETVIRVTAFSLVLLTFTVLIIVVFGQIRFDRTNGYAAVFSNASDLRKGQFVRAAGVEVGKVASVELIDGATKALVHFNVDRDLPLFQSTTASIRYLNLIGDRYVELKRGDSNTRLTPGSTIPLQRTQPALDLDALIGSFRPLFRALDPRQVNTIAHAIITIFQGEGGTINDILDQSATLTSTLADRDHSIGEVIRNLNTILETTVKHENDFDHTLTNFQALIAGLESHKDAVADSTANISNAAGTIADLLGDNRSLLHSTFTNIDATLQPLVDRKAELEEVIGSLPTVYKIVGRAGGSYGDFFNFYVCDVAIRANGLQPGGPVRTVRVWQQPTGRCTPQ